MKAFEEWLREVETLEDKGNELQHPPQKSKGLSPDQKRIHWEAYAKKTERQEEVFKKVFENVFNEQKDLVIAELKRTGQLPTLIDENTAKKFEPAIELVYQDAFESAV